MQQLLPTARGKSPPWRSPAKAGEPVPMWWPHPAVTDMAPRLLNLLLATALWTLFVGPWPGEAAAADLTEIRGCTLVAADWADGDSFRVRLPDRKEITVRLYGADCV